MSQDAESPSTNLPDGAYFLLLAIGRTGSDNPAALENGMRRMGLRPEPLASLLSAATLPDSEAQGWQLRFGPLTVLSRLMADEGGDYPNSDGLHRGCLRIEPIEPAAVGNSVSELRELFKLATLLIDLLDAEKIYWSPAKLWSDADVFRKAVAEMLDSGLPPILHLVDFTDSNDGSHIVTRGLAHFCGQELSCMQNAALDRVAMMRRLVRLAIDMSVNGAIRAPRSFPGLVNGEQIRVYPEAETDGRIVRVRIDAA